MPTYPTYSELVASQRTFFQSGSTRSYAFRKQQLEKLYRLVADNEQLILKAVHEDLNKSELEGFFADVGYIKYEITHALKHLKRWMKPQRVRTPLTHFGSSSSIYREPYGVNLIIAPWNYPFLLTITPLIGAIAGGNTAIVKPSELAVHSSDLLHKLLSNAFPSEYIACVEGGAEETTALLQERFDHIFYTGSSSIGKIIMTAASQYLTPVTLELGGKNPAIVDESANIPLAARRIAWGKLLNAGQTCIAPDYIYVHRSVEQRFRESLRDEMIQLYSSQPLDNPDYTCIINDRHLSRLQRLLAEPTVYYGGEVDRQKRMLAPTILTNVTWDHAVMQEEIFGPITPILTYDSLDEAIAQIKKQEKPLALYLFTENKQVKQQVIREIPFGTGGINDTLFQFLNPNLPFGGVGSSGSGSYHGVYSFQCFTHPKSVLSQTTKFDLPLRYGRSKTALQIIRQLFK
ncbi:aldehyde dehydrogenase [Paenibacillus sp. OV219]|uniref:aldehyde dehydrogenase n=1 Tax=Paenibacillus sp. OV219 TaxID=1884377 RepID=UPI0008CDD16C|nr:aldehyde dehydrogenase [Paenibacillus sp. OV219]SEO00349.1 aldehyde dehydrogenase (NAD+) [Paenibacillus sp. OV219]